jgi:hypothetical protein
MDSMYVVDAYKEIIFDSKVGFQYIDFNKNYKLDELEDKRVLKLHGYLTVRLATNDQGIWVHL